MLALSRTPWMLALSRTSRMLALSRTSRMLALSHTSRMLALSHTPWMLALPHTSRMLALSRTPWMLALSRTSRMLALSRTSRMLALSRTVMMRPPRTSETTASPPISQTPSTIRRLVPVRMMNDSASRRAAASARCSISGVNHSGRVGSSSVHAHRPASRHASEPRSGRSSALAKC